MACSSQAMTYWAQTPEEVARSLGVGLDGLSAQAAADRLVETGPNGIATRRRATRLHVLWRQLRSPLILLLVFAAIASAATGEWTDASIVGIILSASVFIGFAREVRAEIAIGALIARVQP